MLLKLEWSLPIAMIAKFLRSIKVVYLYTWTAEHCGEIVGGQGTECIDVLWTDYNVNGGWGEDYLNGI